MYVISYIKMELEERANEEKFTIKKILQVKAKHKVEDAKRSGENPADDPNQPSVLDEYGDDDRDQDDKLF